MTTNLRNSENYNSKEDYEEMKNYIFSIAFSNFFSDKLNHGLEIDDGWKIFEPSQFVYAYFSFNALYNIDWEKTVSAKKLKKFERVYEKPKIYKLLDFIYQQPSSYTFMDLYKSYDSRLRIIDLSRNIKNIKEVILNKYKFSCKKLGTNDFSREDHENLLIFCSEIRNNIFHGHKSPEAMLKVDQINRITIYKNIISATIDMFMKIVPSRMKMLGNLQEDLNAEENELSRMMRDRKNYPMKKYLKNKSIPDLINGEGDMLALYQEEETGSPRLMLHLNDNKGRLFTKFRKEKLIAYLEGKVSIREVIDSSVSDYMIFETKEKNYSKVPKAVFDFSLIWFANLQYDQIDDSFKSASSQELIKKLGTLKT
jgi:hypothetical protein